MRRDAHGQFHDRRSGIPHAAVRGRRAMALRTETQTVAEHVRPRSRAEVSRQRLKERFAYGVASWLDPANIRLPSAVVTERAFEFVLPSRAREPRTVTTSPAFNELRVQP